MCPSRWSAPQADLPQPGSRFWVPSTLSQQGLEPPPWLRGRGDPTEERGPACRGTHPVHVPGCLGSSGRGQAGLAGGAASLGARPPGHTSVCKRRHARLGWRRPCSGREGSGPQGGKRQDGPCCPPCAWVSHMGLGGGAETWHQREASVSHSPGRGGSGPRATARGTSVAASPFPTLLFPGEYGSGGPAPPQKQPILPGPPAPWGAGCLFLSPLGLEGAAVRPARVTPDRTTMVLRLVRLPPPSHADTGLLKSHFLFAKGLFCTRGFFMTHSPWVAARRLCQSSRGMISGAAAPSREGRPEPFRGAVIKSRFCALTSM